MLNMGDPLQKEGSKSLDKKYAVVTGGAQGIGAEIALHLYQQGAIVTVVDIDEEGLNNVYKQYPEINQFRVNLAIEEEVDNFWNQYSRLYSNVDILVNSAGGVAGQVHQPLGEVPLSDWQVLQDINLTSTFLMCRGASRIMNEGGRIVNISSGAGRSISLTGIQGYASAKAGQLGLTRQLAYELGPKGITVNAIAPGLVLSNPTSTKQWNSYDQNKQKEIIEKMPMRRLGESKDIANAVGFFVSFESSWITGQTLSVDGGYYM